MTLSDESHALNKRIEPARPNETPLSNVTGPSRREFFHDVVFGRIESKLVKIAEFGTKVFNFDPEKAEALLTGLRCAFREMPIYEKSRLAPPPERLLSRRELFRDVLVRHVNAVEKLVIGHVLSGLSVPLIELGGKKPGNAGADEIVQAMLNEPARSLMWTAVYAPLAEEAMFRLLPNELVVNEPGTQWKVGLPAALAFGAMHNWRSKRNDKGEKEDGNPDFDCQYLPLPQIILGATFWHIMRHEGIYFAIFAHALNNGLACFYVFNKAEDPRDLKVH